MEQQRDLGVGGWSPAGVRKRGARGAGGRGGEEEEEEEAAKGSGRGFYLELWHLLLLVFAAVLAGRLTV